MYLINKTRILIVKFVGRHLVFLCYTKIRSETRKARERKAWNYKIMHKCLNLKQLLGQTFF